MLLEVETQMKLGDDRSPRSKRLPETTVTLMGQDVVLRSTITYCGHFTRSFLPAFVLAAFLPITYSLMSVTPTHPEPRHCLVIFLFQSLLAYLATAHAKAQG